jgi:hypothetical protein
MFVKTIKVRILYSILMDLPNTLDLQKPAIVASEIRANSFTTEERIYRDGNSIKSPQSLTSLHLLHAQGWRRGKKRTRTGQTKKISPSHVSFAASHILTLSSQNADISSAKHALLSGIARTPNVRLAALPPTGSSTRLTRLLPVRKQSERRKHKSLELTTLEEKSIPL